MKAFLLSMSCVIAMTAFASDACFRNPKIQGLINASKELDSCFADIRSDPCDLKLLTIEEQRDVNSQRLVPLNRIEQPIFNDAVGFISTDVHDKTPVATAQRVSSCHLITSAHLFYKDGSVPVSPQEVPVQSDHVSAYFHFGQTCSEVRTRESTSARVVFKMTREGIDFVCDGQNSSGNCVRRHFYGRSDVVILRVEDGGRSNNYFEMAPSITLNPRQGVNVNCWGFPGHNQYLNLDKNLSDMVLWHQKDAQIFFGENTRGLITNATAHPGMSGGGCALASSPKTLIGIFADKNSRSGHSAIFLDKGNVDSFAGNFLSPFSNLAERYLSATGKRLDTLESQCH